MRVIPRLPGSSSNMNWRSSRPTSGMLYGYAVNVRGEDVRIYRLRMTPENAQLLLREYVDEVNELAEAPRYYNTLTSNCTNLVFDMVSVIHPGLPMDARVIFSGYLPNYAYDLGATDTSASFEKLRDLSKIHDKAAWADADPNFSAKIRQGIPVPRRPRRRSLSPTPSPSALGQQRRSCTRVRASASPQQ